MKFIFAILFSALFFTIQAAACNNNGMCQVKADSSAYREYVGNYKFTPDAPVKAINVFLQNDTLAYQADDETGTFTRVDGDNFTFAGTNYSGKVAFKRSADGKVNGITIYVGDRVLEATKEEKPALTKEE